MPANTFGRPPQIKIQLKMRIKSILIASGLLGSAILAQGLSKSFGDGTLPEFLMRYDVNDDGIIDEEERQAIKEERKAARQSRRNSGGKMSLKERLAARDSIRERILSKRAKKFAEIAGEDGVLSLEELSSLPAFKNAFKERVDSIFARLDSDKSGDVSLEEFNQRLRNHRPSDESHPGNGNYKSRNNGIGNGDDKEDSNGNDLPPSLPGF
jgi:Ca2+-binding EF-hand superfamily protein